VDTDTIVEGSSPAGRQERSGPSIGGTWNSLWTAVGARITPRGVASRCPGGTVPRPCRALMEAALTEGR